MVNHLNEINGFQCDMPEGAFYAFPNITKLLDGSIRFNGKEITNSLQLSEYILSEAEVAVVPGSAFEAEGYLRLSYATSMKEIKEGMNRLKKLFN